MPGIDRCITWTSGFECDLSARLESITTLLRLVEANKLLRELAPTVLRLPKLWLLLRLALILAATLLWVIKTAKDKSILKILSSYTQYVSCKGPRWCLSSFLLKFRRFSKRLTCAHQPKTATLFCKHFSSLLTLHVFSSSPRDSFS